MPKLSVINYGVGNLRSVKRGLEKFGAEVVITNNPKGIAESDALVLPGVGAFAEAMKHLSPLICELRDSLKAYKPMLGICLGLQVLFTKSYEGGIVQGLGFLNGEVVKLPENVKLPHIGWNSIEIVRFSSILDGVSNNSYMYFVHTYIPKTHEKAAIVAQTEYGIKFPCVIATQNLFGTQFHPEKSGKEGLKILKNFVQIVKR
jgi:glutamine amidotransferase